MPRRAPRLLFALLAALCVGAASPPVAGLELEGAWFVIVHYRDDTSHDPAQLRWEDRIWRFERKGDTLEWSDYPIVVFQDESGRFEGIGGNRMARVVGAWEPNEAQQAQIRAGLEYNTRGAKTKALRGSDAQGWRSASPAATASAHVVTYSETWSIEGLPNAPAFSRLDVLGSGSAHAMEGRTLYQTEEVDAAAGVLRGRFERDGVRHGTFRMMRTGAPGIVKGSGKTQGERVREVMFRNFGPGLFESPQTRESYERAVQGEEVPEEVWQEVRVSVRREVEARLRARGGEASLPDSEIDRITDRVVQSMREGRALAEIDALLDAAPPAP